MYIKYDLNYVYLIFKKTTWALEKKRNKNQYNLFFGNMQQKFLKC